MKCMLFEAKSMPSAQKQRNCLQRNKWQVNGNVEKRGQDSRSSPAFGAAEKRHNSRMRCDSLRTSKTTSEPVPHEPSKPDNDDDGRREENQ